MSIQRSPKSGPGPHHVRMISTTLRHGDHDEAANQIVIAIERISRPDPHAELIVLVFCGVALYVALQTQYDGGFMGAVADFLRPWTHTP